MVMSGITSQTPLLRVLPPPETLVFVNDTQTSRVVWTVSDLGHFFCVITGVTRLRV